MVKGIIAGILLAVVLGLAGGYIFIVLGGMPANADSKPGALETWAAHKSLRASIQREAPKTDNPLPLNNQNLVSGIHLYAVNCAVCHGTQAAKASNIALGLYQRAPQLAKHGVEDDPDGVIYWKIQHGIRLTGMPGFSGTLSDQQLWQLTLFLKHMDSLPPVPQKVWKALHEAASPH